ncbi:hypothetical protein BSU04_21100 [Caballeronia sordidicola]|uniref:Uncharacterized protein n=1 Tax=Caballeronia sordidicola TaxID=196367 RepID=A0A226WZ94_CABSO|nr:hypothetical protein BSU04_21100 [Caballeronia sordidicola]
MVCVICSMKRAACGSTIDVAMTGILEFPATWQQCRET